MNLVLMMILNIDLMELKTDLGSMSTNQYTEENTNTKKLIRFEVTS